MGKVDRGLSILESLYLTSNRNLAGAMAGNCGRNT